MTVAHKDVMMRKTIYLVFILFSVLISYTPITHAQSANPIASPLQWSSDGQWLLAIQPDETCIYDVVNDFRPVQGLELTDVSPVVAADFIMNTTLLITGHADGFMRLWDMVSGAMLAETKIFDGAIADLAVSPDGQWLALMASH